MQATPSDWLLVWSDRNDAELVCLYPVQIFQSPVNGTTGEYVMKISLGTPPQERIAIVDTGSDLVWLQCQCGSNCVMQPDPLFDPTASTSYSAVPCNDSLCAQVTNYASYILNPALMLC